MSVINKMLRDLDQRHASLPGSASSPKPGERVTLGVLPVSTLQRSSRGARRWRMVWALLLLLAAAVVGWWVQQTGQRVWVPSAQTVVAQVAQPLTSQKVSTPAAVVPIAPVAPQKAADLQPLPSAQKVASQPAPATTKVITKVVDPKLVVPRQAATVVVPPVLVAAPGDDAESLRMESSLMRLPASQRAQPLAGGGRSAALEALAQAQSLWNAGSHAAATELMQQALGRLESATVAVPVTAQSPLASLARELARMELADGQVSQALARLTRLEPQLSQLADVWAMRGNAAQRLGRHAEAAQSYKQALALKPDEPRWMLGTAVSLAAQGQTGAAGELADKARVMGALRPEVANYLRQLGVAIRTD